MTSLPFSRFFVLAVLAAGLGSCTLDYDPSDSASGVVNSSSDSAPYRVDFFNHSDGVVGVSIHGGDQFSVYPGTTSIEDAETSRVVFSYSPASKVFHTVSGATVEFWPIPEE